MSPDQVLVIILVSIGAWTVTRVFRGPLGEALARRIGGASPVDGHHGPEHAAKLAEVRERLSELEERIDFTERVPLQERQQGELGQGGRS